MQRVLPLNLLSGDDLGIFILMHSGVDPQRFSSSNLVFLSGRYSTLRRILEANMEPVILPFCGCRYIGR